MKTDPRVSAQQRALSSVKWSLVMAHYADGWQLTTKQKIERVSSYSNELAKQNVCNN